MVSGAGLSSLIWRALRHWMKIKAICPSTFLLSFLRLCMSPEIMQHQGAQKWEQHKGLLWHIDPLLYVPVPPGNIQNPAVLGVTAGLCPGQGPAEQAEQGNPSSWRGNHQKQLGLAPSTFGQLYHTCPPHSLQHVGPWQEHPKEKSLGQISSSGSRWRRVGLWLSHQVGCVQHGHPSCHAAVRVLDGLGAQQVPGSLVQHQLLALPARERESEPLQSTQLVAFPRGSGMYPPCQHTGHGRAPGLTLVAAQALLQMGSARG